MLPGLASIKTIAAIIGAIVVVVLMVVAAIWIYRTQVMTEEGDEVIADYTAEISPSQRLVVEKLVNEIAPLVRGKAHNYKSILAHLDGNTAFDSSMYVFFGKRLSDGSLTIANLIDDMTTA